MKNIIKTLGFVGLVGVLVPVTTLSCEDMLTVDTGDKTYQNANDTLYSYLGILKHVQDVAERTVLLGELRGDLLSPTEYMTDTLHAIANFDQPADGTCSLLNVSDYYAVINNCNLYLANADTSAIKNNEQYMLPEYAQVQAIRAWTYLQLVLNYGQVPFISQPIASLDVVKNFDYESNLVDKDNLVDRLLEEGLSRYVNTDYPSYGTYNNGAVNFSSRLCFFPIRLILGDLYLLRGASQSDYLQAAQYYYDYLRTTSSNVPLGYCYASLNRISTQGGNEEQRYSYGRNTWGEFAQQYTYGSSNEVITTIPSSANKQFGTILTRIADVYGYTPSSSQSTETSTDDDGEESVSSSGAITVTLNTEAQTKPSPAYHALSMAQTYIYWNTTSMDRTEYECGDARYHYATQSSTYDGETYLRARKAASGDTFYYGVPVYRKTLVWLRMAEALNRAGYPQLAFGILKDGLNEGNYPDATATRSVVSVRLTADGDTVRTDEGHVVRDTTVVHYVKYNTYGALHYVDSTELASCPFDFTDDAFASNYGIHARGSGIGTQWMDVVSGSTRVTNLTGYNDSIVFDYAPRLLAEGVDVNTASQADIINAVENVICDELALESSFEGYRFGDLVRMAQHKNTSGYDGTTWLAAKIADRDVDTTSETSGTRDESIYAKLLDTSNWFLPLPAWSVK